MEKAWNTLLELGALDPEENLTALGKYMVILLPSVRWALTLLLQLGYASC